MSSEEKIDRLEREVYDMRALIRELSAKVESLSRSVEEIKADISDLRKTTDDLVKSVISWNGRMVRHYVTKENGKAMENELVRRIDVLKWAVGIWAGIITTVLSVVLYLLIGR